MGRLLPNNTQDMVRPERGVVLAGESPVRVSAGAPGSRLQPSGEIHPSQAECRKPLKERGASQRAATTGERCSHAIVSAEKCLGGPRRLYRGEGNRQHSGPERMLDLSGAVGGGTLGQSNAEQERPYLAAKSSKDRAYKAGWLKSRGARRESEGVPITEEGAQENVLEGRDPALDPALVTSLGVSVRAGRKRPITSMQKCDNSLARLSVCAKCTPSPWDSANGVTTGVTPGERSDRIGLGTTCTQHQEDHRQAVCDMWPLNLCGAQRTTPLE